MISVSTTDSPRRLATHPTSISKMSTPRAHQSTAFPWPRPWIISGARYSGVPQSVYVNLRRQQTSCNTTRNTGSNTNWLMVLEQLLQSHHTMPTHYKHAQEQVYYTQALTHTAQYTTHYTVNTAQHTTHYTVNTAQHNTHTHKCTHMHAYTNTHTHPSGILLANPKSVIRMWPQASRSMFSGLRSR